MRTLLAGVTMLLGALLPAAAQDPLELLREVAAHYRALGLKGTYDVEWVERRQYFGKLSNRSEQHYRAVAVPGRSRNESVGSILWIDDGEFRWSVNPERNEYVKERSSVRGNSGLSAFTLVGYGATAARLVRQETLELRSGPVLCQVIEVERESTPERQESPITYWIDAARKLVLKQRYRSISRNRAGEITSESEITTTVLRAEIGKPPDEALFRYVPPPGAVEVERLIFGQKSLLVGQPAPEFDLTCQNGETISGRMLRGRWILLVFVPRSEDDSLIHAELLHRALADKGLAVVSVLHDRPPSRQGTSLYTHRIAIDRSRAVSESFGVTWSGRILIDPEGNVAQGELLLGNWRELANRLRAAGIW